MQGVRTCKSNKNYLSALPEDLVSWGFLVAQGVPRVPNT
jgi:hypothetical protein